MRRAWLFILAVAALDLAYTWTHQATFREWEWNPVALAVMDAGGIGAVLACRTGATAFAATTAAVLPAKASRLITGVWVAGAALVLAAHLTVYLWGT